MARTRQVGYGASFAIIAATFALLTTGGTLPIPLYSVWGDALGFGAQTTTWIFAIYVLGTLVDETAATSVHIAADFGPYGAERDASVEEALTPRGVDLVRTGSPYAVAPGRVTRSGSSPYQVFSPFARAWRQHGWRGPAGPLPEVRWSTSPSSEEWPAVQLPQGLTLEVRRPDARSVLVPYRSGIEERVDVEERTVVLDPPAGLLD